MPGSRSPPCTWPSQRPARPWRATGQGWSRRSQGWPRRTLGRRPPAPGGGRGTPRRRGGGDLLPLGQTLGVDQAQVAAVGAAVDLALKPSPVRASTSAVMIFSRPHLSTATATNDILDGVLPYLNPLLNAETALIQKVVTSCPPWASPSATKSRHLCLPVGQGLAPDPPAQTPQHPTDFADQPQPGEHHSEREESALLTQYEADLQALPSQY